MENSISGNLVHLNSEPITGRRCQPCRHGLTRQTGRAPWTQACGRKDETFYFRGTARDALTTRCCRNLTEHPRGCVQTPIRHAWEARPDVGRSEFWLRARGVSSATERRAGAQPGRDTPRRKHGSSRSDFHSGAVHPLLSQELLEASKGAPLWDGCSRETWPWVLVAE